jgi:hypothetical protein
MLLEYLEIGRIKREKHLNVFIFHNNRAATIDKTYILLLNLTKQTPTLGRKSLIDVEYFHRWAFEQKISSKSRGISARTL